MPRERKKEQYASGEWPQAGDIVTNASKGLAFLCVNNASATASNPYDVAFVLFADDMARYKSGSTTVNYCPSNFTKVSSIELGPLLVNHVKDVLKNKGSKA
jgi:hypothetical protein